MLAAIPKPKFNKQINGSKKRITEKTLPENIAIKEATMKKYIIEDFKVEDFRNVELSQIRALANVL